MSQYYFYGYNTDFHGANKFNFFHIQKNSSFGFKIQIGPDISEILTSLIFKPFIKFLKFSLNKQKKIIIIIIINIINKDV